MQQPRRCPDSTSFHLKLRLMTAGLAVSRAARRAIEGDNEGRLIIKDYPTTDGLTVILPGQVYANAVIIEEAKASMMLEVDETASSFSIRSETMSTPVDVLPHPTYVREFDPAVHGSMTHADRVRLSPIDGCAFACAFCDSHLAEYRRRTEEQLMMGLRAAQDDSRIPARHALISGGTPRPEDTAWLDDLYEHIITEADMPVDVMLAPRDDLAIIDRLHSAGARGLSMNIELFGDEISRSYCPSKHALGHHAYESALSRAVDRFGAAGQVRSLILIGLEPIADTLRAVEFVARLGADPVLSPFRPARGTSLQSVAPPDADLLLAAWERASEIVERYGVKLGPRCIPCQHNTLTAPDDSGAYYFSG